MNFKQSLILLFVGIMSCTVLADFEEYDVFALRNMLRAQSNCPIAYSNYASSCETKFQNDIKQCEDNENQAKLKLKEESLENRKAFAAANNKSCEALSLCDNDGDVGSIYNCYSLEGAKAAQSMNNMYYRANELQTSYNANLNTIKSTKTSCTEKSSQEFSNNTNKGIMELTNCLKTGEFKLAPVESDAPKTTTAPEVSVETSKSPEVSAETSKAPEVPTTTEAKAPTVTEKPLSE